MLSVQAALRLFLAFCSAASGLSQVRLNEVQVVGTHNSYHQAPPAAIQDLAWNDLVAAIAKNYAQSAVNTTQYDHLNFTAQLDLGVRSLEIDLYPDPAGGVYDQSVALRIGGADGWFNNSELQSPGFKVLHEPDVDYGSSCVTFANCLGLIADWHNANPNHFPIIVMLNQKVQGLAEFLGDEGQRLLTAVMKTSQTPGPDGVVQIPAFDATSYQEIEAEVRSVLNESNIVTPDAVRGSYSSLSDAVLPGGSGPGWPLLSELWGKFMVVWTPESYSDYLNLYPNLQGALCFVSVVDGNVGNDPSGTTVSNPAGVFIQSYDSLTWDQPVTGDEISSFESKASSSKTRAQALVEQGYMVISFTDEDCNEARNNFTARRDALVSAGSQILKTDFPVPATFFPSDYQMVPFSSSTGARCNPVLTQNSTAQAGNGSSSAVSCTDADLSSASSLVATAG